MKNALRNLWVMCLCTLPLISSSCAAGGQVLKFEDIQHFQVSFNEGTNVLTISGLAFHSALAVEKITTTKNGSDLIVEVFLIRARPGMSGSFLKAIFIEPDISRVLFGTEKHQIWSRY